MQQRTNQMQSLLSRSYHHCVCLCDGRGAEGGLYLFVVGIQLLYNVVLISAYNEVNQL